MGSEGVADNYQGWSNALCTEDVILHCYYGVYLFFINGSLLLEVCVCLSVCLSVCVCVYVCMCVCTCVCMCTRTYMCVSMCAVQGLIGLTNFV